MKWYQLTKAELETLKLRGGKYRALKDMIFWALLAAMLLFVIQLFLE